MKARILKALTAAKKLRYTLRIVSSVAQYDCHVYTGKELLGLLSTAVCMYLLVFNILILILSLG